jgi:vancomycin permeability regulator SanA
MRKIIKGIIFFLIVLIAYSVLIPLSIVQYGKSRIYRDTTSISQYDIAIVFGAGIIDNKTPNDMLKDRLDTAYNLYLNGKVEKLLLSGDNSEEDYNEPQVMYDYLVFTLNMPPEDAVRDFAGR